MTDFLSEIGLEETEVVNQIRLLNRELQFHLLHSSIKSIEDVRIYMQHQIWCVWDFMTLIKSIQLGVTNTSIYWLPTHDASLGAYVYTVLLSEETDIKESGCGYSSHFETYLRAMEEAQADTIPIKIFIENLRQGKSYEEASTISNMPKIAKNFVDTTIKFANLPLHITVAVFCLSRENIIPSMFKPFLKNLPVDNNLSIFRWYLKRHIELDSESHGPMSVKLFKKVVTKDEACVKQALEGALEALEARKTFLDEILCLIKQSSNFSQK